MSSRTGKVLYARLLWAEYLLILEHLTLPELLQLGLCCKDGYVAYLREGQFRQTPMCKLPRGRFLRRSHRKHEKVLLVSYPRSGNSLMRSILEAETGIITGSDSRTNRTLSAALLRCGFIGEGVVDDSVWIVKSHYPERMGYVCLPCSRVVLVVRNVVDSIESYFHMGMTNTHDKRLSTASFERLRREGLWDAFIESECNVWKDFYSYWIGHANTGRIRLHVVRYEDLLSARRGNVIRDVLSFLTTDIDASPPPNLPAYSSAAASEASARKRIASGDHPSTLGGAGYGPKQGGVGRALRLLSPEQIEQVLVRCRSTLDSFGYGVSVSEYNPSLPLLSVNPHTELNPPRRAPPRGELEGVLINEADSVRRPDDRFGRHVTVERRRLTDGDSKPFDTE